MTKLTYMNIRFLETFVWVARLNSFKAAADKLFATPASISNRISTLEDQLGVRLFERDPRTVTLTAQGSELLPLAERMVALQLQLQTVLSKQPELKGVLRLGVIETVVLTWLPNLLTRFAAMCPQATIELHCDFSPNLRDELLRGALDVVITAEELTHGFVDNHLLASYEIGWVTSPAVAVKLPQRTLEFSDLAQHPILSFHRSSSVYRNIAQGLNQMTEVNIHYFSSLSAMVGLTCSGFGISPLPLPVVLEHLAIGRLILLDVTPKPAALPLIFSLRTEPSSALAQTMLTLAQQAQNTFSCRPR